MKILVSGALVCAGLAQAQFGRSEGDWVTAGTDAQRTSWVRLDSKISLAALQKPGFDFLWKIKVDAPGKQAAGPAMMLNSYIGYRGFRSLAFVGVRGNSAVSFDTDLGRQEWRTQLLKTSVPAACAEETTPLVRATNLAIPTFQPGRGANGPGRGSAARSTVSAPGEGSVILNEMAIAQANRSKAGPASTPQRPATPPRTVGGLPRNVTAIYAIASDGMLHSIYASNAEPEPKQPPITFLPAGAAARGLIVFENTAVAVVAPACGAPADSVMALDFLTKQVSAWKSSAGSIAGTMGAAFAPDGTAFVATTGGEIQQLEPLTLKPKAAYKAGAAFASSPAIFDAKEKIYVAAIAADGRIHIVDSSAPDRAAAVSESALAGANALATWQDTTGARWLAGSNGQAIVALKVAIADGAPAFQAGWTSPRIAAPLSPIVVNGVVFTASGSSAPGVLYALDGNTGKELWNSGKAITASVRGGSVSSGNNRVYLGSVDGNYYAFGFPIEH